MGRVTYTVMENTPGEMRAALQNVVNIANNIASHPGNNTIHITQLERVKWDKAATDSSKALTDIGDKTGLQTSNKTNIVSAVNELFTSANNGKTAVASAITEKGVSASPTDTFAVLAEKIGQINTGKKFASGEGVSMTAVNIRNLPFKPSIVLVRQGNTESNPWTSQPWRLHFYCELLNINTGQYNYSGYTWITNNVLTAYNDGFYVVLDSDNNYNKPYKWIAIE